MSLTMDPGEQQFFEQGEQPLPEALEAPKVVLEPLSARVRRARLRRIVGAALLASVALCGAGLLVRYSASRARAQQDAQTLNRRVTFEALLPRALANPLPAAPSVAAPTLPASASVAVPTTAADPSELIGAARALLEAGHTGEGVAAARLAVDANPSNAEPYILLAAGLQDEGHWAEAQRVFAVCKQKTSSGPNATCRYFAGH